jgi:hypothetical protein
VVFSLVHDNKHTYRLFSYLKGKQAVTTYGCALPEKSMGCCYFCCHCLIVIIVIVIVVIIIISPCEKNKIVNKWMYYDRFNGHCYYNYMPNIHFFTFYSFIQDPYHYDLHSFLGLGMCSYRLIFNTLSFEFLHI